MLKNKADSLFYYLHKDHDQIEKVYLSSEFYSYLISRLDLPELWCCQTILSVPVEIGTVIDSCYEIIYKE